VWLPCAFSSSSRNSLYQYAAIRPYTIVLCKRDLRSVFSYKERTNQWSRIEDTALHTTTEPAIKPFSPSSVCDIAVWTVSIDSHSIRPEKGVLFAPLRTVSLRRARWIPHCQLRTARCGHRRVPMSFRRSAIPLSIRSCQKRVQVNYPRYNMRASELLSELITIIFIFNFHSLLPLFKIQSSIICR